MVQTLKTRKLINSQQPDQIISSDFKSKNITQLLKNELCSPLKKVLQTNKTIHFHSKNLRKSQKSNLPQLKLNGDLNMIVTVGIIAV